MFIKKDTRKIFEILADNDDSREYLKLSKRPAEFQGTTKLFFKESNLQAFLNLKCLNLYDNELTSVQGIGLLAHSPVADISLGMNKLTSLPLEFGLLGTLTSVWLDDNLFEEFPVCLCQLQNLATLRLTGNSISDLPASFSALENLEILALDNNSLTSIPSCVWGLLRLRELWLRQNKISEVGEEISALSDLEVFSISSNALITLPSGIASLAKLKKLYANGNQIASVPAEISALHDIETINLAGNRLKELPPDWIEKWGQLIPKMSTLGGGGSSMTSCDVVLLGNPLLLT